LIYSEIENSVFPVPEMLISVSLVNSEKFHLELSACTTTIKSQHQWSPDSTSHRGNGKRRATFFTNLELEISMRSYGEFQQVFRKKCNTAVAAKERETAWENIAAQVNA